MWLQFGFNIGAKEHQGAARDNSSSRLGSELLQDSDLANSRRSANSGHPQLLRTR